MAVPKGQRIVKGKDFSQIRESGQTFHFGGFIAQAFLRPTAAPKSGESDSLKNEPPPHAAPRLGVIASRRVGNAVKRNRGKRLMRHLFRLHGSKIPQGCDLVCILRTRFDTYSFDQLQDHFRNLTHRLQKHLTRRRPRPPHSTALKEPHGHNEAIAPPPALPPQTL